MITNITKAELDELAQKYDKSDFIEADPISTAHKYAKPEEIEVIGFIAALFAYGSRKVFIPKLNTLFSKMGASPIEYLKRGDFSNLDGFNYRFAKEEDVAAILSVLSKLYNSGESLGSLFKYGYETTGTILGMFKVVTDYFYSNAEHAGEGFYFMLANPNKGGAMKRMNMYLRWMVRKSEVDFGIWDFIPKSELLIPLDVHVARISREMNLLTRKSNDFKAVLELTNNLKQFDSEDPVKYDFAIYGLGINRELTK